MLDGDIFLNERLPSAGFLLSFKAWVGHPKLPERKYAFSPVHCSAAKSAELTRKPEIHKKLLLNTYF